MSIYKLWKTHKNTEAICGASYVGRIGEIWYCLSDYILRIGDGVTPGGVPVNGTAEQYDRLVDVDGNCTYVGEAEPGSAQSGSVWRIKRITETGEDLEIVWANGSAEFDKVWNDRASYSY